MRYWLVLALVLLSCLRVGLAQAAELHIAVMEDARVENATNADNNYGDARQLKVGKYTSSAMRSYLKFNLSTLQELDLDNAWLVLYSIGGSGIPVISVHSVEATWEEESVTWNSAPGFVGEPITFETNPPYSGLIEFNITAAVRDALISSDNTISLLLKVSDESKDYNYRIFMSKENPSNTPYLRVEFTPHAPQITTVTAPTQLNEGEIAILGFSATDADNDITSYAIYVDGVLVSNTNATEWQPNYEDSGTHEVRFVVYDSTNGNDTQTVNVEVQDVENLVINEFLAHSRSPGNEWIELFNPLATEESVNDCYITESGGFVVPLSGIIPSNSYGIVSNLGILDNEGDEIKLFCSGVLVDRVAYGIYDDGNTGDNAPLAPMGNTTGRRYDGYDTDTDSNDFVVFSQPSFEAPNEAEEYHDADTNHDGCVSMSELLAYIGLWKADPIGIGMERLLSAIALWKANPICQGG